MGKPTVNHAPYCMWHAGEECTEGCRFEETPLPPCNCGVRLPAGMHYRDCPLYARAQSPTPEGGPSNA